MPPDFGGLAGAWSSEPVTSRNCVKQLSGVSFHFFVGYWCSQSCSEGMAYRERQVGPGPDGVPAVLKNIQVFDLRCCGSRFWQVQRTSTWALSESSSRFRLFACGQEWCFYSRVPIAARATRTWRRWTTRSSKEEREEEAKFRSLQKRQSKEEEANKSLPQGRTQSSRFSEH